MAQQTRTTLKTYFNTGDTPTEAQFIDLIDSSPNPTDDGTTGSGSYVRATSPTLVTPTLGAATATSVNKVAITAPATGATITPTDGTTTTLSGGTHSGTNTGDQTITLTSDVTGTGTGSFAATIANDAVTNAKLANMATQTIKGRTTAGTGDPEDLTATQATAILNAFTGDSGAGGVKGLVPAPAAGDASKFLKGDGTFASIPGGGDALVANPLSQFAATTSLQLKGVISDETGSGALVFADTPTLVTPVLGTPTSGTLTNCSGLPLSGVVDSTTEALGVGSLELGHASDTTISRVSAGVAAIEGNNILTANNNVNTRTMLFRIDNAGSVITTGEKKLTTTPMPVGGTIVGWTLLSIDDTSGSITLDIWKDSYANYPPTVADTITASAKPSITTATKNTSSTLTGWTTTFSAGDIFRINVDSVTSLKYVILALKYTVTN